MPRGRVNEYVENGRLVKEWPDADPPVKTTQCLTEECIQDHVNKSKCSCDSCASGRVDKTEDSSTRGTAQLLKEATGGDDFGGPWSIAELREMLPEEKFEAVMEHLDLEDEVGVEKGVIDQRLLSNGVEKSRTPDVPADGVDAPDFDSDPDVEGGTLATEQFYKTMEESTRTGFGGE